MAHSALSRSASIRLIPYPEHSPYFGAIVGRVANRIGKAKFSLDGATYALSPNEGANQLHGGPKGFGVRNWTIAAYDGKSVTLTLDSPDGDMGYPGALDVSVTYTLNGHRLDLEFNATTSQATPVNITQHNYFNLMGQGDVGGHTLWVAGHAYTRLDDEQIPTGEIVPVAGTDLDFTTPRSLSAPGGGTARIDHNFCLDTRRDPAAPVVVLTAPDNSLTLRLFTDQPGLQVYSGWKLDLDVPGLDGASYPECAGLCLEDQIFPDAINNPHFPSPVITPQAPYRHHCAIEIK